MWIFCKAGFFSAVRHRDDPRLVLLRARFKGDLERLLKMHGIEAAVEFTPGGDYAYRASLSQAAWESVVQAEAHDIDYTNFKDAVHDGTSRDPAYMRVWAAMRAAQEADLH